MQHIATAVCEHIATNAHAQKCMLSRKWLVGIYIDFALENSLDLEHTVHISDYGLFNVAVVHLSILECFSGWRERERERERESEREMTHTHTHWGGI